MSGTIIEPRAADVQVLPGRGLFGPGRGRAIAVQHEVDVQLTGVQVIAAWRVVAHRRLRAVALDVEGFQRCLFGGVLREQQLDVIVGAQADKARQLGPPRVMRRMRGVMSTTRSTSRRRRLISC
jgi:hypothetical protein